jgi:hypothetical protein
MEVLDVCGGHSWRVLLRVRDEGARHAVARIVDEEGHWVDDADGARFEVPWEDTTDATPIVAIDVATQPSVEIVSRLGDRTTRVRASSEGAMPASVRPATEVETVEMALRWITGRQHLGCWHIGERAFLASHTEARVFVVPSVDEWTAASAPLPPPLGPGPRWILAALIGQGSRFRVLSEVGALLDRVHPEVDGALGLFVDDDPGATLALVVAELT